MPMPIPPAVRAFLEETGVSSDQVHIHVLSDDLKEKTVNSIAACINNTVQRAVDDNIPREEEDSYLLLQNVPRAYFNHIDKLIYDRNLEFDPEKQVLLVELPPSAPHEQATASLSSAIADQISKMGFQQEIKMGNRMGRHLPGGWKQPDQAFWLHPLVHHLHWPVIVIETGFTGGTRKLREDARRWLVGSGSRVGNMLTLRVGMRDDRVSAVVLCRWRLSETTEEPVVVDEMAASYDGDGGVGFGGQSCMVLDITSFLNEEAAGRRGGAGARNTDIRISRQIMSDILRDAYVHREVTKRQKSPSTLRKEIKNAGNLLSR
ncbi:hypothetical protein KEM55_006331 [Ascosphaera atra]|nr:hypothetical protein KEM55_006331 [Ascosphaera atra]